MTSRVKPDREVALSSIEENRRLREFLQVYARHHDWCAEWPEMDQPCDCGLTETMATLPSEKVGS